MSQRLFLILFLISLMSATTFAEQQAQPRLSVAVLDFGESGTARLAAETLDNNLRAASELKIIDRDQARSAARGSGYSGSLNLSLTEARNLGAVVGSDFYILGDSQTLRRSPSSAALYFEAYASIFLVSSRTGKLLMWQRPNFRAASAEASERLLLAYLSSAEIRNVSLVTISKAQKDERVGREIAIESDTAVIDEAPDDDKAAAAQGLRLPRPYRRLRPPYPETAASAEAEATVDVLLDLDVHGEVGHIEIARWAGFGLDEATVETVRQLHFFPAMRNGTAVPLRILLRYNFRKPAK